MPYLPCLRPAPVNATTARSVLSSSSPRGIKRSVITRSGAAGLRGAASTATTASCGLEAWSPPATLDGSPMLGSARTLREVSGKRRRPPKPLVQRYTPTTRRAPSPKSTHRKSHIAVRQLHRGESYRFVDVDGDHSGHAGLVHRHAGELMHRLHRRLVVSDDDELNASRHLAHDLRETTDVRIVERRIHLVEQAERRRIELEDGEDERDGCQRLFST